MGLKKIFKISLVFFTIFMINLTQVYADNVKTLSNDKRYHEIILGSKSSFKYDLDGDGKAENFNYKETGTDGQIYEILNINNSTIKQETEYGSNGISVIDLNKADKYKEIAIFNGYDNDYTFVYIYSYKNKKLKLIGSFQCSGNKLYINNACYLSGCAVNQFFQTDIFRRYYKYNPSTDKITEVELPFYPYSYYATGQSKIKIKCKFYLRKTTSLKSPKNAILYPGETLKAIGLSGRWVLFQTSKGVKGWILMSSDFGNKVTELNKDQFDVFEGVFRAG